MNERVEFFVALIRRLQFKTYLELGIRRGETFVGVAPEVELAIGVDITDSGFTKPPNAKFFEMRTDQFFQEYQGDNIDFVFIDADHTADAARRDLENSLDILNPGGLILMHDSDPIESFRTKHRCGEVYKVVDWIDQERPDLCQVTLPYQETGMTLVMRKADRRNYGRADRDISS